MKFSKSIDIERQLSKLRRETSAKEQENLKPEPNIIYVMVKLSEFSKYSEIILPS